MYSAQIVVRLIEEIKICLENGLYYTALLGSLTLPDACGRAEYPTSSVTERYIKWYNAYIGDRDKPTDPYGNDMPYLSGEVVYNLRNSMLHSGNPDIEKEKIKEERCKIDKFELIFTDDVFKGETSGVSYSSLNPPVIHERSYSVNALLLCNRITKAAQAYCEENEGKFTFFDFTIEEK